MLAPRLLRGAARLVLRTALAGRPPGASSREGVRAGQARVDSSRVSVDRNELLANPARGPALVTWAPGRVNLIGEHTDYSGGLVLPVAIQLGVTVDVHARASDISLTSRLLGSALPFRADGAWPKAAGWARYAQAVAAELAVLGRPSVGLVATVSSDLPAGSGLSSSAALEVAIALALCAVADWELEPMELALACQRAELRAVGVPCGILDQAASILGREGAAVLLDCGTLEHRLVSMPRVAALLIADSGVERSLENTAYAQRRGELEDALRAVGAARSTAVQLSDLERVDGVAERRLRHVVTENERVRRFAAALESGDLASAGALLTASHTSLRDDYEVSISELDLLVELARDAGAYGARLLGAGFGGTVLVLVDHDHSDDVAELLREGYSSRTGRDCRPLTVFASEGATVRHASA
jgi:galactokinase